MPELRVSVFRRADKAPLYDATFGSGGGTPGGEEVWSLVRAFLQLSRGTDGGGVRRIVFREGALLSGARAFGAPRPRPLVEVAVAHGAQFVVLVTTTRSTQPQVPRPASGLSVASSDASDAARSNAGSVSVFDDEEDSGERSAEKAGRPKNVLVALCDRVLKFIVAELLHPEREVAPHQDGDDAHMEAGEDGETDAFDIRAYMESLVSTSDSCSSFFSTEDATSVGSGSATRSSATGEREAVPAPVEIDVTALAEEVESAVRGL